MLTSVLTARRGYSWAMVGLLVLTSWHLSLAREPLRLALDVEVNDRDRPDFDKLIDLRESGYVRLRLLPDRNADGSIALWSVELYEVMGAGVVKGNLLEPSTAWHGIQPFMIVPRDVDEPSWRSRPAIRAGILECSIEILSGKTRERIGAGGERALESVNVRITLESRAAPE